MLKIYKKSGVKPIVVYIEKEAEYYAKIRNINGCRKAVVHKKDLVEYSDSTLTLLRASHHYQKAVRILNT